MSDTIDTATLRTLLAVAWAGGALAPKQRQSILTLAERAGVPANDMAELEKLSEAPVSFHGGRDLSAHQKMCIYVLAGWVLDQADGDGDEDGDARAALFAVSRVLGISPRGKEALDRVEIALSPDGLPNLSSLIEVVATISLS